MVEFLLTLILVLCGGVAQAQVHPAPSTTDVPWSFVQNQTAAITIDGYAVGGFTQSYSARAIFNQSVMSGSATGQFQNFDGLRGLGIATVNSTVSLVTGVAGYTLNNTVPGVPGPVGQNTVTAALGGYAVCQVDKSNCWGIDTIVSDNPSQTNTGVTTGTGKVIMNEFDLNVTSPNTQVVGLSIGGTALPTNVTLNGSGLAVTKLWGAGGSAASGSALFTNGLILQDGCCAAGVAVGAALRTGNNVSGMPIELAYHNSAGVEENVSMTATPGGFVSVSGTQGAGWEIANGPGVSTGVANTGLSVGVVTAAVVPNSPSQYIVWNYLDSSSAVQNYAMRADATGNVSLTGSAAAAKLVVNFPAQINGALTPTQGLHLPVSAVASLPACNAGNEGLLFGVPDAVSPTYNAALTGGGTVHTAAYCNGAAWTTH